MTRRKSYDTSKCIKGKTYKYVLFRTMPYFNDSNELNAIILSSLRSMFGTMNIHDVTVIKCYIPSNNNDDNCNNIINNLSGEAILRVKESKLPFVISALTLTHSPSYLNDIVYRFDFIRVFDKLDEINEGFR